MEKEHSKTSPTREGCAAVRTGRQEQPLNLYWVGNGIHVAGGKGTVVSTEPSWSSCGCSGCPRCQQLQQRAIVTAVSSVRCEESTDREDESVSAQPIESLSKRYKQAEVLAERMNMIMILYLFVNYLFVKLCHLTRVSWSAHLASSLACPWCSCSPAASEGRGDPACWNRLFWAPQPLSQTWMKLAKSRYLSWAGSRAPPIHGGYLETLKQDNELTVG